MLVSCMARGGLNGERGGGGSGNDGPVRRRVSVAELIVRDRFRGVAL